MVSMTMMALAPPVGAVSSRSRSATFVPTTSRTSTITCASKSTSSAKVAEEKGFWETFFTGITKEEQLYETSPILKKVDDSNGATSTVSKSKTTKGTAAPPPPKKSGGFGGLGDLFAKK